METLNSYEGDNKTQLIIISNHKNKNNQKPNKPKREVREQNQTSK